MQESRAGADYLHQPLHEEVTAIGGTYLLVKELRLPFQGRELLYLVGHAIFDSSCCGAGGCAYALVPGFVLDWKGGERNGLSVSRVEPIHDPDLQRQICRLVEGREVVQQVLFLPGAV